AHRGQRDDELETSPRAARTRLSRPNQPPPLTTRFQATYTENLTSPDTYLDRKARAPGHDRELPERARAGEDLRGGAARRRVRTGALAARLQGHHGQPVRRCARAPGEPEPP